MGLRPGWRLGLLLPALWLGACQSLAPGEPGLGRPLAWDALPGWSSDRQAEAWPALRHTCTRLAGRNPAWQELCAEVRLMGEPDDATARAFFETRFVPYAVNGDGSREDGLITGYYEPLLRGHTRKTGRYRYPLYKRPPDLLTVDLSSLYPELDGRPVRGRLLGRRVVPYYSRAEIENGQVPLAGLEIAWVDDPVDLFFLHIQGSGRVRLNDGRELAVGYTDQNGHPYESIGRELIRRGEIKPEDISLHSIKEWLATHPDEIETLLNTNPSYIFFDVRDEKLSGPLGSLNVPLTPGRSVAVDRRYIPLGSPVWLDTTLPQDPPRPYRRLMFAQDTGGAIKGPVRADVFFGRGDEAEMLAGNMKQQGRLYVLMPVPRLP